MRFGTVPLDEALGAILAHSVPVGTGRLRKGRALSAADLDTLRASGLRRVTVARLGDGDVGEDEAAAALAASLVPDPAQAGIAIGQASTGRVNLHAARDGLFTVGADAVLALNSIDPTVTLATLPDVEPVTEGQMVGTVKIISYGVPSTILRDACEAGRDCLRVIGPPARGRAGLLVTRIGEPSRLEQKGVEAVRGRLAGIGVDLVEDRVVAHDSEAIAQALPGLDGDMALILTASATSDLHDTAPEAVRLAGGSVERFGMPVDPGNLLFLGTVGHRPVIGLPGCARSPALNGVDWVLRRVAYGLSVEDAVIAAMGVGGLLKDTPARGHPGARAGRASAAKGAGHSMFSKPEVRD